MDPITRTQFSGLEFRNVTNFFSDHSEHEFDDTDFRFWSPSRRFALCRFREGTTLKDRRRDESDERATHGGNRRGARDTRGGKKREATESSADLKLMRMRERTRCNCGRRWPSTSVAKRERWGSQGLGTNSVARRLWSFSGLVERERRLPSSPLQSLRYCPTRFKIRKVADPGWDSYPPSSIDVRL